MLLWEVLLSGSVSLLNNAESLHETGTDFSARRCLIISRYTEGYTCVEMSEGENSQG